jgi:hypothetical protein
MVERGRADDPRRCRDLDPRPQWHRLVAELQREGCGIAGPAQQGHTLLIAGAGDGFQPELLEALLEEIQRDRLARLGRPAPVEHIRAQCLDVRLDPVRRQDRRPWISGNGGGGGRDGEQQQRQEAFHRLNLPVMRRTHKRPNEIARYSRALGCEVQPGRRT